MTLDSMPATRLDLVTRLYELEAEIANIEEAIAALDAVMPEARPTRRWQRHGSPLAMAVAAVLIERRHPVRFDDVVALLAARGVESRNTRASVSSALQRLARRGLARRVARGTYEWAQQDTAEAIVERVGNIIPFVPREERRQAAVA